MCRAGPGRLRALAVHPGPCGLRPVGTYHLLHNYHTLFQKNHGTAAQVKSDPRSSSSTRHTKDRAMCWTQASGPHVLLGWGS